MHRSIINHSSTCLSKLVTANPYLVLVLLKSKSHYRNVIRGKGTGSGIGQTVRRPEYVCGDAEG